MKLGFISDLHFGYYRGNKVDQFGVNQREADIYTAGRQGIRNLLYAGVDAIIDLGDMAHVPSPKKRAITRLVDLINSAGVPYYSVNGNHTLQRTKSDINLYDVLYQYADNFHGYVVPTIVEAVGGFFIPYGTAEEVRQALIDAEDEDYDFIVGHWACDDVPFPGDHITVADLPNTEVFLGHYHTRKPHALNHPTYIGSTERFAWGEWQNPTGVAVFDTETRRLEFINHETRRWHDIEVDHDQYLEDGLYEDIEGNILRVTINATPEQYASLDLVQLRKRLAPALEFQIRRTTDKESNRNGTTSTAGIPLNEVWHKYAKSVKIDKAIKKRVIAIGEEALT